jgi:hypothetical protein
VGLKTWKRVRARKRETASSTVKRETEGGGEEKEKAVCVFGGTERERERERERVALNLRRTVFQFVSLCPNTAEVVMWGPEKCVFWNRKWKSRSFAKGMSDLPIR